MARLAREVLVLGLGGRIPLAEGRVLRPPGHLPHHAGWHSHGQPGGDGWPLAGRLATHQPQVCVGPRAGPVGLCAPVRPPRAAGPHDCLAARWPPPAQGALPHEALGVGAGRMESGGPPLPPRQAAGLVGGPPARGGAVGEMAHPPGRGLHRPHPQGGAAGAPEHPPAHCPVHGLPTVGGGAPGGRHCVAGGLGPPGGLWFPPGKERPGRGGGDTGLLGAVPPPGVGRREDEHRLRQVFRSHPPSGRAGPGIGAGHGPGHVSCPGGHVQAAPPGLQDRGGLRPMVAGHQWHPPRGPTVR